MSENPSHIKQIHRISRIIGQLEGVKKMIDEKRYCPEILNQTKAISSAVRSLEMSILEDHMGCCVSRALASDNKGEAQQKMEELLDIFRKRLQ